MCDECPVIRLTVVTISVDTFSRGHFIFWGHRPPIRSDNTSNVAYINPQSGMFSCQLLSVAQKSSKHLASQKLGTDHVEDWVLIGGIADSSQSYWDVEASHMILVLSQEGVHWRALPLRVQQQQHTQKISSGLLCKGYDACWSPSDFIMACLFVPQWNHQTMTSLCYN